MKLAAFFVNQAPQEAFFSLIGYIEAMLSFNKTSKSTLFDSWGYYEPAVNTLGTNEKTSKYGQVGASPFDKACKDVSESATQNYIVPIFVDFFQVSKYLPPNIGLQITFQKSAPNFYTIAKADNAGKFRFEIDKIHIVFKAIETTKTLLDDHTAGLMKGQSMIFPLCESHVRFHSLQDKDNVDVPMLFSGILPHSFYLAFIKDDAFIGNITENPWVMATNYLGKIF